jgi:hypothetical protein
MKERLKMLKNISIDNHPNVDQNRIMERRKTKNCLMLHLTAISLTLHTST